jgi:5-methyltetrahydropteroyltriglutamate--homocysteine methyltransferase
MFAAAIRLEITLLVLEYATDRAGALIAFEGKELGLGVVNPRTEEVETPAQIRIGVDEVLGLYPAERVFLNPDCGFRTFSNPPMNTRETASRRLRPWRPRPVICADVRERGGT